MGVAYEVRVQVFTDDEHDFNLSTLKLRLAQAAESFSAVQKVWVNDQLYFKGLDVLEDEEYMREVD